MSEFKSSNKSNSDFAVVWSSHSSVASDVYLAGLCSAAVQFSPECHTNHLNQINSSKALHPNSNVCKMHICRTWIENKKKKKKEKLPVDLMRLCTARPYVPLKSGPNGLFKPPPANPPLVQNHKAAESRRLHFEIKDYSQSPQCPDTFTPGPVSFIGAGALCFIPSPRDLWPQG